MQIWRVEENAEDFFITTLLKPFPSATAFGRLKNGDGEKKKHTFGKKH